MKLTEFQQQALSDLKGKGYTPTVSDGCGVVVEAEVGHGFRIQAWSGEFRLVYDNEGDGWYKTIEEAMAEATPENANEMAYAICAYNEELAQGEY